MTEPKHADPPRKNWQPLILLLFFVFLYMLTGRGHWQNSDETVMYAMIVNLVEEKSLAIDQLAFLQETIGIGAYGPDGHLYSKYPLGNVSVGVIQYTLGNLIQPGLGNLLVLYQNVFWGAIGVVLLYQILRLEFDPAPSFASAFLFGLTTDWWHQSRGFGSESGSAVLLLGSLFYALRGSVTPSAISLAFSMFFRPFNVIVAPALAAVFVPRKSWLKFGALIAGMVLILVAYNLVRYGDPLETGYQEGFTGSILSGLYGILFSPGRSIFVYSPILLLALPGSVLLVKKNPRFGWGVLAIIFAYVLPMAAWNSWHGGWSWGSRLFTPILPFIMILTAPVIAAAKSHKWLWVVIILLALAGIFVQLTGLAQDTLLVLKEQIMGGSLTFADTLYTLDSSWLALQVRALADWTPASVDSLMLRVIFQVLFPATP